MATLLLLFTVSVLALETPSPNDQSMPRRFLQDLWDSFAKCWHPAAGCQHKTESALTSVSSRQRRKKPRLEPSGVRAGASHELGRAKAPARRSPRRSFPRPRGIGCNIYLVSNSSNKGKLESMRLLSRQFPMTTYLLHDIFLGQKQRNATRPAARGRAFKGNRLTTYPPPKIQH